MVYQNSNSMLPFGQPAHGALQYRGRKKRVPESISELLTARALAYWFMDDGTALFRKAKRYYVFNTQSFIFEDQKRLVQALSHNFGIHATIQKQLSYYKFRLRRRSK